MKYSLSSIAILVALLISSCSKDDKLDISVAHKLIYNGEPLVMLTPYSYPDGRSIQFSRVSYYTSDVSVSDASDTETLSEVDMINFADSNTDATNAATGVIREYRDVSLGDDLSKFSFNIGLTAAQNATTPEDYNSSNPLSESGEYWGGWKSYVFAKIEGTIDLDNDGERESTFAFHIGSDAMMRQLTVTIDQLPAKTDDPLQITISTDLYKVFNNGSIYDIDARTNIHSKDHLAEAKELIDNWTDALSFTLQ